MSFSASQKASIPTSRIPSLRITVSVAPPTLQPEPIRSILCPHTSEGITSSRFVLLQISSVPSKIVYVSSMYCSTISSLSFDYFHTLPGSPCPVLPSSPVFLSFSQQGLSAHIPPCLHAPPVPASLWMPLPAAGYDTILITRLAHEKINNEKKTKTFLKILFLIIIITFTSLIIIMLIF